MFILWEYIFKIINMLKPNTSFISSSHNLAYLSRSRPRPTVNQFNLAAIKVSVLKAVNIRHK